MSIMIFTYVCLILHYSKTITKKYFIITVLLTVSENSSNQVYHKGLTNKHWEHWEYSLGSTLNSEGIGSILSINGCSLSSLFLGFMEGQLQHSHKET